MNEHYLSSRPQTTSKLDQSRAKQEYNLFQHDSHISKAAARERDDHCQTNNNTSHLGNEEYASLGALGAGDCATISAAQKLITCRTALDISEDESQNKELHPLELITLAGMNN